MTEKKTIYPQMKAIDFMQTMRLGPRTKGRNTQCQRYCLNRAVASIVEHEKKSNRNANLVEESSKLGSLDPSGLSLALALTGSCSHLCQVY